jgi:2-phosphoglycerate kinase
MTIDILLQKLAKPAQRAIQNEGITSMEQLSQYSEKEMSRLHGIGKNAMDNIKKTMSENGLSFSRMQQHIHIFGASGSGTTSIAQGICKKIGYQHFDSDDCLQANHLQWKEIGKSVCN